MKTRRLGKLIATGLAVAVPMAPLWGHLPLPSGEAPRIVSIQAEGPNDKRVFLPLVNRGSTSATVGPPSFEIVSPVAGATFGGAQYFEIQPVDPAAIRNVEFRANDQPIGTDTNGADGWKVFVKASDYPAGSLKLTATAAGPGGGPVSKSITVMVQPTLPSTTTIETNTGGSSEGQTKGATIGTSSGNTVVVLPDAAPLGTTLSVADRTQAQIEAETKVDYEALGVTFLGGVKVDASNAVSRPVNINTSGFGNRVKPGEAVVQFAITPDADGDGVGELAVSNGATVGPDGMTVLANSRPEVVLSNASSRGAGAQGVGSLALGVTARPGQSITVQGSGFNIGASNGMVGVFRSGVDGREIVVPGTYGGNAVSGPSGQAVGTVSIAVTPLVLINLGFSLPVLPPGPATLTLRNELTGSTSPPVDITVQATPPLSRPAAAILDDFMAQAIAFLGRLDATGEPDLAASVSRAQAKFTEGRQQLQQVRNDPNPIVQQALTDAATVIEGSGVIAQISAASATGDLNAQALNPAQRQALDGLQKGAKVVAAVIGITVAILGGIAAAPFLAGFGLGLALGAAILDFYLWYDNNANPCNPGGLAGMGNGGAGSAPPTGGSGCGNAAAGGGGGGRLRAAASSSLSFFGENLEGRIAVKIFSDDTRSRQLAPFTGVTDKTGYFFVPLIPQGEPFTAIAVDRLTGKTRTYRGVGPQVGNATPMFFDFTTEEAGSTPISLGQVVSTTVSAGDGPKAYGFTGISGTVVGGSYGWSSTSASRPALRFEVLGPDSKNEASFDAGTANPTGFKETPEFKLSGNGTHTVLVSDAITGTGSYTFTLGVLTGTVSAPDTVATGAAFDVAWTGPNRAGDWIGLYPAGETISSRYVNFAYTRNGNPVRLRAPDLPLTSTAQLYEVRYISGQSNFTLNPVSEPITVNPVSGVSVDAPASVASGASFDAVWSGPDNGGDYIAIYTAGETNNSRYLKYVYTSAGKPARLRAPDLPAGSAATTFKVRYISGQDYLTWAEDSFTVTPVTASVDAPATVASGAAFDVAWTGPNNQGDYIAIYTASETNNNRYLKYVYTSAGKPARLRAPDLPKDSPPTTFKVRYLSGQDYLTWAEDSFTVTPVTASVSGPASVGSGAEFDVAWTGPNNQGDYIAIYVATETNNNRYLKYVYTSNAGNNVARLRAPDLPTGSSPTTYEVRYVSGQDELTWASYQLTVNPVSGVSVDAPATVASGAAFDVAWTGPNNPGDYIAIYTPSETNNNRYLKYVYTSNTSNNLARLTAPTTAGTYEVRYVSGQSDLTWAKDSFMVP